uniref:Putative calcium-binding EF-hand-containing protein n=1 Tax=Magnetococcus massalia (strain MO-1) TaxID=451514 RepID=A0A1S7LF59_MAGMO|nr:putative calcium-binding EF-hand-containing protein [Candidatus Magnetococcus massalia]
MGMGSMGQSGRSGGMGGPGQMGQPPKAEDLISRMDQDGNGTLNVDEIKGPLSEKFGEVDGDGDGELTSEELQSAMDSFHAQMQSQMGGGMGMMQGMGGHGQGGMMHGMGHGPSVEQLLADMDEDGDDAISSDEARGPLADMFDEVDGDGDGLISQSELEEGMANMPPPPPPPQNMQAFVANSSYATLSELFADSEGDSSLLSTLAA